MPTNTKARKKRRSLKGIGKNTIGRPNKMNEAAVKRAESILRVGGHTVDAAASMDIGETTFHEWMKRGLDPAEHDPAFPEFRKRILAAKEKHKRACLHTINLAITGKKKDANIALKWLATRYHKQYGVQRHELTGKDGEPLVAMSPDLPAPIVNVIIAAPTRPLDATPGS